MATVVLLTNKKGSRLEKILDKALEKNCEGPRALSALLHLGSRNKILTMDRPPKRKSTDCLNVFDPSFKGEGFVISGTGIFSSCCCDAIKTAERSECNSITCGTSPLDTLSIASCSDREVMVSLQREIQTLKGDIVEPCEICVKTEEKPHIYPTLAATACLLMLGTPFENGYLL